jgi:tetratricopeptide (TPR) repeat protein
VTDIEIDATVMMTEREALAKGEELRAPLDTALKYYEMARIADRLGLYEEAKEYVTNALQTSPDARLQARLAEYETKLADLIRQKELLIALGAARQLAKKNKFQTALDLLKKAKEEHKPTDAVLAKWEEVNLEVDFDFTEHVIEEWYKQLKSVVQAKLKQKDSRDMTVNEAMNWARREMDVAVQDRLAAEVGSENPADVKTRFMKRHKLLEAKLIRLGTRKASFREDGFYQIVGGHLPVAGKQKQTTNNQPGNNQPGGRRQPSGNGNGNNNGSQGSQAPRNWDDGSDGFQDQPKPPTEEEIREALRRILGGEDEEKKESSGEGKSPVKQDISKLKVPEVVPTLNEWWEKASSSKRTEWLTAVYVKFAGTMMILELDDWDIKYR